MNCFKLHPFFTFQKTQNTKHKTSRILSKTTLFLNALR
ncbi:hypothetical protein JCM19300_2395 [Algibacter lectus]|uniref:Uncharacterized protein n=1 Tax=Algibacter lectus TaxID=221126 RepID=A0A090W490_9FLAO|nr:hypothetical protein JCM19300_2395 [Algibacter lectus]